MDLLSRQALWAPHTTTTPLSMSGWQRLAPDWVPRGEAGGGGCRAASWHESGVLRKKSEATNMRMWVEHTRVSPMVRGQEDVVLEGGAWRHGEH